MLQAAIDEWTDYLNARLRKRYAAPFADPVPPIVKRWVKYLVIVDCYDKRGCDPSDQTIQRYVDNRDRPRLTEIKRSRADSVDGLFDLPLRADTTATGVSKGGPLVYSEQSPYVWTSRQARAGRENDRNGSG